MMEGYDEVWQRLGDKRAPEEAARIMIQLLSAAAKSPQS